MTSKIFNPNDLKDKDKNFALLNIALDIQCKDSAVKALIFSITMLRVTGSFPGLS